MDDKLKVAAERVGTIVVGWTVHMPERFRGEYTCAKNSAHRFVNRLTSVDLPDLGSPTLFLDGNRRACDGKIFARCYESAEDAKTAVREIAALVAKANGTQEETAMPSVPKITVYE